MASDGFKELWIHFTIPDKLMHFPIIAKFSNKLHIEQISDMVKSAL